MIVIFCQSPINSKQPDDMYRAEADAARLAGMEVRLIDFEALVGDGNVEKALRLIPKSFAFATPAVYRGWMMTPEQYLTFYRGLSALGLSLINQPQEYKYCHYLPEWLPELSDSKTHSRHKDLSLAM